jgi:predicted NBD/HSP70 family sugar kinase
MGLIFTVLNPPLFIIAGKLAEVGELFTSSLEKSFARHTVAPPLHAPEKRKTRFVVGKFRGNDDTVMGAVALVLRQHGRIASDVASVS